MALFVKSARKRQLDDLKQLASVGYSSGVIASMSLSKKRPRFDEVFKFPKEENQQQTIQQSKAQLIVWAEQLNRLERAQRKKENKNG